jgi:hypothetical protein
VQHVQQGHYEEEVAEGGLTGWVLGDQRARLLVFPRLQQRRQPACHNSGVFQVDERDSALSENFSLVVFPYISQRNQQIPHVERIVEGNIRGRVPGDQRPHLCASPR